MLSFALTPPPSSPQWLLVTGLILHAVLLVGCASVQPYTVDAQPKRPTLGELSGSGVDQDLKPAEDPRRADLAERFRTEVERYYGIPHRRGGVDERGFDCSGLMIVLYRDLLGLELPRTTTEQANVGDEVGRDDLAPGDMVFFKPPKTQHVGVYLGNGEFAHASSSSGVMISELNEPYWERAYWTSRRVYTPRADWLDRPAATPLAPVPLNTMPDALPLGEDASPEQAPARPRW